MPALDLFGLSGDTGLTGDQLQGLGTGITGIGNAVGSLFSAEGDYGAASDYAKAIQLTKLQTAVKENQVNRQITQTIGQEKAATGANGFQLSGSNADIIRASAQQGGLSKGLVALQGQMQENAYATQESAARNAGNAGIFGGIAGILGTALSLF